MSDFSSFVYMPQQRLTWDQSQHPLEDRGKPRKPVARWPVAGPSGCVPNSRQQSGKTNMEIHKRLFIKIQFLSDRKPTWSSLECPISERSSGRECL